MTGTHGLSSSHVFSRGSKQPSETRDLSRPALRGDGSRAEDRVQRPAVPRWAPATSLLLEEARNEHQIQDLLVERLPRLRKRLFTSTPTSMDAITTQSAIK